MPNTSPLPEVKIYSDGWANPNPGPGWYGIILCYRWVKKEFYQGYQMTTNNRMELTGVITGLSKLTKKSQVTVYTDSQYTINGIVKWWAKKWQANSWYRTKSQKAVNYDLWEQLLDLVEQHEVEFEWVKWHNGHVENERCDELATLSMSMKNLLVDEGFETSPPALLLLGEGSQWKSSKGSKDDIIKVIWKWDKNIKVEKVWDPCRKCWTAVVKKKPKHTKKTLEKAYYYEYYLSCPGCNTNYMVENGKRDVKGLVL